MKLWEVSLGLSLNPDTNSFQNLGICQRDSKKLANMFLIDSPNGGSPIGGGEKKTSTKPKNRSNISLQELTKLRLLKTVIRESQLAPPRYHMLPIWTYRISQERRKWGLSP